MKEKLLKQLDELSQSLANLVAEDGPGAMAAWKARRKIQAAHEILSREWSAAPVPAQNSKLKTQN